MSPATAVILAIAVIALIAIIAVAAKRQRTMALQHKFGHEYDVVLRKSEDRAQAERELAAREQRVRNMHIEELPAGARDRYTEEWRTVQAHFVDRPQGAVREADSLVMQVMRDRGYPVDSFEQRVADISPDHPRVVDNYRAAHGIAARCERGDVSTEDLRKAMVHYRTLFEELLGTSEGARS